MAIGSSLLFLTSCGRESAPPPAAVPVEQVPLTMERAFEQAAPEIKDVARGIVAAVQGQDDPTALLDLQHLNAQPGLTQPQREAALRSMLAVQERLRSSAEKGDKKAEEALEQYRSTK